MLVKTSELTNSALDWAVALAQGATNLEYDTVASWWFVLEGRDRTLSKGWSASQSYSPSTDWSQGGPIIERERITVWNNEVWWHAAYNDGTDDIYGQTPLIAAMRCLVASHLGDEVEIPEELCKCIQNSL